MNQVRRVFTELQGENASPQDILRTVCPPSEPALPLRSHAETCGHGALLQVQMITNPLPPELPPNKERLVFNLRQSEMSLVLLFEGRQAAIGVLFKVVRCAA